MLAILRVEKHWAKVKTSAIVYSLCYSLFIDLFHTFSNSDTPPSRSYHSAWSNHSTSKLTCLELRSFSINDSIALIRTLNSRNRNSSLYL